MTYQASRDPYLRLLRGSLPYTVRGLRLLINWVQQAAEIIYNRRHTVSVSNLVYGVDTFGPVRDIRLEEYDLLTRIGADLDRLIALQFEQLAHLCDIETGHVWIYDPLRDLERCNVCDAVHIPQDELPAYLSSGTESD